MDNRYQDFDAEERELLARSGVAIPNRSCPAPDLLLASNADVLPDEVALPVRNHIAGCEACQALCASLAAVEVDKPAAQEAQRIRARLDAGLRPSKGAWWGWLRWPVWVAAAVAVAGVGIGVYLNSNQPAVPVAGKRPAEREPYRLPLDKPPLKLPLAAAIRWRGDGSSGVEKYLTELGTALVPYRGTDFAAAVPLLLDLTAHYPKAPEAPFYLAVSLLQLSRAPEAITMLEETKRRQPDALSDDVDWYLGVAWERNGDRARAADYLKPLCSRAGAYQARACEGLERLK